MSAPEIRQDRAPAATGKAVAGATTQADPLPAVLLVLTFVTGLVDAVSFLGLGRVFTANMTGNVVFLAFAVAGAPGLSIPRSLVSLIAFLVGAALGGRLGVALAEQQRKRWLITSTLVEALLLLAAALVSFGFDLHAGAPVNRLYVMIILTALAMGLRNATVRRLGVPDLTTTVLTLTLTGIAADSSVAGGGNPRFGRRIAAALTMFGGAAIGTLLLHYGLVVPLLLSSAVTLAVIPAFAHLQSPTNTKK